MDLMHRIIPNNLCDDNINGVVLVSRGALLVIEQTLWRRLQRAEILRSNMFLQWVSGTRRNLEEVQASLEELIAVPKQQENVIDELLKFDVSNGYESTPYNFDAKKAARRYELENN